MTHGASPLQLQQKQPFWQLVHCTPAGVHTKLFPSGVPGQNSAPIRRGRIGRIHVVVFDLNLGLERCWHICTEPFRFPKIWRSQCDGIRWLIRSSNHCMNTHQAAANATWVLKLLHQGVQMITQTELMYSILYHLGQRLERSQVLHRHLNGLNLIRLILPVHNWVKDWKWHLRGKTATNWKPQWQPGSQSPNHGTRCTTTATTANKRGDQGWSHQKQVHVPFQHSCGQTSMCAVGWTERAKVEAQNGSTWMLNLPSPSPSQEHMPETWNWGNSLIIMNYELWVLWDYDYDYDMSNPNVMEKTKEKKSSPDSPDSPTVTVTNQILNSELTHYQVLKLKMTTDWFKWNTKICSFSTVGAHNSERPNLQQRELLPSWKSSER